MSSTSCKSGSKISNLNFLVSCFVLHQNFVSRFFRILILRENPDKSSSKLRYFNLSDFHYTHSIFSRHKMGFMQAIYSGVTKRTSTFVVAIAVGAFMMERGKQTWKSFSTLKL